MSKLEFGVLHFTATPKGREVSAEEIIHWHTDPKPQGNGWRKSGYTDMFHLDGSLTNITPYDQDDEVDGYELTNGVRGINSISRHFVIVAGGENMSTAQEVMSIGQLISVEIYIKFLILRHPNIKIAGHNQFSRKICPGFDVPDWLASIGVARANIYCP